MTKAAQADFPSLSSEDIVKLHAATTLSLCAALDSAGLGVSDHVSRMLTSHATGQEAEAWARVAHAIANALATPNGASERDPAAKAEKPAFIVIPGGLAAYADESGAPP